MDCYRWSVLFVCLLGLGLPGATAQTLLADNFDARTVGASELSAISAAGLSWTVVQGEITVTALTAQPTVANSRALKWPKAVNAPQDTIVIANEPPLWSHAEIRFGWTSKYVRRTAGLVVLYKDPQNFYFVRVASVYGGELIRRINGTDTVIGSADFKAPDVGDTIVTPYVVRVRQRPSDIQIEIDRGADGTFELSHLDTTPAALSTFTAIGQVGFRWGADNGTYVQTWIDYLEISEVAGDGGGEEEETPSGAAPAVVADLLVAPSARPGGYRITFTAPDGDPQTAGMQSALAYDIRYSTTPIADFAAFSAATKLTNTPDAAVGGTSHAFDAFSLPAGPLHFRMAALGPAGPGALSNSATGSPAAGQTAWEVPANGKVGIDLRVAGVGGTDYVYETLFYDRTIDDHGVFYLRDTTELSFAHNAKNALPSKLWKGGVPGVSPHTSASVESLAGTNGAIRYKVDADGLRQTGAKQAYVVNGETYGSNTYKAHKMFQAYTGPFTIKSFYDSIDDAGFSTPSRRVGAVTGTDVDEKYHKGFTDPETGEEWHELGYWDDDMSWNGNKESEGQASDGRITWLVLNPKSPAPTLSAGSGGRFFTTRPKAYYQGRVVPQTTYFSGDVTLTLTNLTGKTGTMQYRVGEDAWTDYTGPVPLGSLSIPAAAPTALQFRVGTDGAVKTRTIVKNPVSPAAGETHPVMLFRAEERDRIWNKIQTNTAIAADYKKLKTQGNQIIPLMTRNYEVDERVTTLGPAGQTLSAAFVYGLEGAATLRDSSYTGEQVALKAFRSLLAMFASYDPLSDESQAGQWSSPCGEVTGEWWDRGLNAMYATMAYDLIAGLPSIDPIDEHKLREALAQEAYLKLKFIPDIRGNWNLKAAAGLLTAAYAMPSYDSPAFGGAAATQYEGNPYTPGLSWMEYVENENLVEGLPGGPKLKSTLWDSVWEDGVSKESSSYDASGRVFLTYFLNLYTGFHGTNLMEIHPQFARAYEWSMRTRYPWNRNYQSYGQARYTLIQDVHLLLNSRFENTLDLGLLRWHYDRHTPALGINPNGQEPIPFAVAWHDPSYISELPADRGSKAYHNNMMFQTDFSDANAIQLYMHGRETSWEPWEAHRKDDSTTIMINAFGERFLTNTDELSDWLRSNSESQNVILVDDPTAGPVNDIMSQGPSRATIATMKGSLTTPFIDYGMMATQTGSAKDKSVYKDKAQLDRHILFPDHRFFVMLDDMKSVDGQNHTYSWTGHCHGTLDVSTPQRATFTKASGRKLDIQFFGPAVSFETYSLNQKIDWGSTEVPVPYFVAKASGIGVQYLSTLFPKDLTGANPIYGAVSTTRGHAGKITLDGSEFLVFSQPEPRQEVTVDGKMTTSAKFALAKSTGGVLEYIFVVDGTGPLSWSGTFLFDAPRSYLYLPVDPATSGPSVTTIAETWAP